MNNSQSNYDGNQKQMETGTYRFIFCSQCGKRLDSNDKFCSGCGSQIEKNQPNNYAERKQEYAGKLIKCPNCGEILKSFTPICPACGLELRESKATGSVRELAYKLEQIEARREYVRSNLLLDRLYGKPISRTDEQKINLIRSFPVPNTKEDLYEFMILAGSNIDFDIYKETKPSGARFEVSNAWVAKMEQAYQKAKMTFKEDIEFEKIHEIYVKTNKRLKRSKGATWRLIGFLYLGIIAFIVIIGLSTRLYSSKEEAREIERLETIVAEIENALEDGEYKLALMNATTLEYQGYNDEQERRWNIQKEIWIERVIEEATVHGVQLEYIPEVDDDENNSED